MPIEQVDISKPHLFAEGTAGNYFARLRRDAPVHCSNNPVNGGNWSVSRYHLSTDRSGNADRPGLDFDLERLF